MRTAITIVAMATTVIMAAITATMAGITAGITVIMVITAADADGSGATGRTPKRADGARRAA